MKKYQIKDPDSGRPAIPYLQYKLQNVQYTTPLPYFLQCQLSDILQEYAKVTVLYIQ